MSALRTADAALRTGPVSATLAVALAVALSTPGAARESAVRGAQSAVQSSESHVLIVSGIGGERQFADSFYQWGARMHDAAVRSGVPAANVTFLAEDPARDPQRVDGRSTRPAVEAAIAGLAVRLRADDRLFVLLVGHGSQMAEEPRFNLPGPDVGASDFARLLAPVRARVAFVNASSASGEFLAPLRGPRRVVVTATRSGMQRNHAVFGQYFVTAFAGDGADTDKDGRISLLEAFVFARNEVKRRYERQNALQTEHAQLDDTSAARTFYLGASASEVAAAASPATAGLAARKARLEEQIGALRRRKESMSVAEYDRELERLLVELATTNAAIRRAGAPRP